MCKCKKAQDSRVYLQLCACRVRWAIYKDSALTAGDFNPGTFMGGKPVYNPVFVSQSVRTTWRAGEAAQWRAMMRPWL